MESSGNPIAINVNRIEGRPVYRVPRITSAQQAAQVAHDAIRQGYNVDLGLMQVNSRNLANLGYTVEQMFDRCTNIRAGGRILSENYTRAVRQYGAGQNALLAALSAYNTGNFQRGFRNGYISRYLDIKYATYSIGAEPIPATSTGVASGPIGEPPPNPLTAELSVYSREGALREQQQPDANPNTSVLGGD